MKKPARLEIPQEIMQQFNAVNNPAILLIAMMFLLPALGVPSELILQDSFKSAIAAFCTLGCGLLFFWQQRNRSAALQWHGLVWLPVALMVYALGSMVWSHTYLAGVEAIRWFIFSLILWLGLNTFNSKNIPMLVWAIHGGAFIASLWAVLQFWLDFSLFPQYAFPSSTFINRNFFAEYIVCTLPFSVWALATMRQSIWLAPASFSMTLNIIAIMMTGTRSALFSMMIIIPILIIALVKYRQQLTFITWSKTTKILVSLLIITSIICLGSIHSGNDGKHASAIQVSFSRTTSVAQPTEYTEGSLSVRRDMWKSTIRMISANKFTGIGAGAWEVRLPLYQPDSESMEKDFYAHNEYLQLVSEYGFIVGGLFLAVLSAYLLIGFEKTWKSKNNESLSEAPARSFVLTSLLALFLVSGVGFPWHLASTGCLFAVCLGLLAKSDTLLNIRDTFFAARLYWQPKFSKIALSFLMCATLLAGYITAQAAQVEYKMVQAILYGNSATRLRAKGLPLPEDRKKTIISNMQDAIAINPHYRKLMAVVAGQLAENGDWANAVSIWRTTIASRPYVPALWQYLAYGYSHLGKNTEALQAAKVALQLQPNAAGMYALEVNSLSESGEQAQARQILNSHFDDGSYDYALAQSGYALGVKTKDWPLAIRSLELRNKKWPEHAADAYFRLGNIYVDMKDDVNALAAFQAGFNTVPDDQKDNFRKQVPEQFRDKL